MRVELEAIWFEEHEVTLSELAELCGLPQSLLEELVGAGAIVPLEKASAEPRFGAQALATARAARRLRADFDLDSPPCCLRWACSIGCTSWSSRCAYYARDCRDLSASGQ